MLKTIIAHEVCEYIKSSRFMIGLGLIVTLVAVTTWININDYVQRQQDYLEAGHTDLPMDAAGGVYRPPHPLSILIQGKDRELGDQLTVNHMGVFIQAMGYMGYWSQYSRFMSGFTAIDFAFIVRIVMSLLVVFMVHDRIAQEVAQGTLRLMMSNAVSRSQVLLGKMMAGLGTITGLVLMAALVAGLVAAVHPRQAIDRSLLSSLAGISLISVLYLGVFLGLGLLVSTFLPRPSTALLVLLQLWVVGSVIYPQVGVLLAQKMIKTPDAQTLKQRKEPLDSDAARQQVDLDYNRELTAQVHLARRICLLCPAVLYDRMVQRLARTDIEDYDSFVTAAHQYCTEQQQSAFVYSGLGTPQTAHEMATCGSLLFLMAVLGLVTAFTLFLRMEVR